MSRSVNKAVLLGHVGQNPEVRTTASGTMVASVSLATGRQWTDKSGQKQEKTEWHRLVLWDKLADIAERYVTKGSQLYVEGEIEYRSYEDKDGVTKYMTEIRVRELVLLGSGGDRQPAPSASRPKAATAAASYEDFATSFPDDDELPF